jgi:hypothetical protein
MQIKQIYIAAGGLACMLLGWPAFLAAASNEGGQSAAEEIYILQAQAEDEAVEETELVPPQPMSEEKEMAAEKKPVAVPIRSSRPRVERHRDARACLDAGDNLAIIKCAEKYRYR